MTSEGNSPLLLPMNFGTSHMCLLLHPATEFYVFRWMANGKKKRNCYVYIKITRMCRS